MAAALQVWLHVKELADKTVQTFCQLKYGLLSDYLKPQMKIRLLLELI